MPDQKQTTMVKSKTVITGAAIAAVAVLGPVLGLEQELVGQIIAALTGLGLVFLRLGVDKAAKVVLLCVLLIPATGCWEVHERDSLTIKHVEKSIKYRESDWERIEALLDKHGVDGQERNDLEADNKSELGRFEKWLKYEQAKQ